MRRAILLGLAVAVFAGAARAGAALPDLSPAKKPAADPQRLLAWSDRVVYHADTGKFTFSGTIIVLKGDLRVDCDKMEGLVDTETRQLIKITATGNVQMLTVEAPVYGKDGRPGPATAVTDAWRATSHQAVYDLRDGRIVMKGGEGQPRPRLWRAKGYGEANTIIFVPDKGEYELIGDPIIRGEIPTGPAGAKSK